MRVVVPYTKLAPQTLAAVPSTATLAWVGSHEHNYWGLLTDLWRKGDSFVIVEHDIVPRKGALRELQECPHDWCAFPYPVGTDGMVTTALGCTKFGAALLARHPRLLSDIPRFQRGWNGLDAIVIGTLHQHREVVHEHLPPVGHLRPGPKPRRKTSLRLKFVGDGTKYLEGIPSADHEQTDPVHLAQALESGLYVEDTTPAPKKPKAAPAPAEADTVTATDVVAPSSEE